MVNNLWDIPYAMPDPGETAKKSGLAFHCGINTSVEVECEVDEPEDMGESGYQGCRDYSVKCGVCERKDGGFNSEEEVQEWIKGHRRVCKHESSAMFISDNEEHTKLQLRIQKLREMLLRKGGNPDD